MNGPFVDAHCHLADPRWDGARGDMLARAACAGIGFFIQGGVGPDDWDRQMALMDPRWLPCFGLHPWWVAEQDQPACRQAFARLETVLPRAMALGELGLDFHPRFPRTSHDRQREWFERQLSLARVQGKPVVLHVVRGHDAALKILQKASVTRGMVHGFSGGPEVARGYLDLGLLISVGGAVTRQGYHGLKSALSLIPEDRLVIESDAPDMPPLQRMGGLNEPAFMWDTAHAVATLRRSRPEHVLATSTENLHRTFKWELST